MTEQEIRAIVQNELQKQSSSGSPFTNAHAHNGIDGLIINPLDLKGFSPIPTSSKLFLNENTGKSELGFGAQLAPGSATHSAQTISDTTIAQYPIAIVNGNGSGPQGSFNGGYAPDGTMLLFATALALTSFLYIRAGGQWYEIAVNNVN